MLVNYALAGLLAVLVVVGGAFLLVPTGGGRPSPVSFDDTLQMGLSSATVRQAEAAGNEVPRAEVFFSQYQYVVGYAGLDALAAQLDRPEARQQFGRPLAVFVTDYANADPYLSERGYLRVRSDPGVGWTAATDAVFVVDSGARTPAGPTPVPFSSRDAARAFAARYGGDVVGWDAVVTRLAADRDERARFREAVANRSQWADRTVARTDDYADRPVSVVVGRDVETLPAAVERAPPNTTVRLPPGTYETSNLTVEKPLTIRGAGPATRVRGDGTGTVIRLFAPRTAVTSLRLSGVGPNATAPTAYRPNTTGWDAKVRAAYGYGDAAIVLDGANRSLVRDVRIETPTNGVVVRHSDGSVVADVAVNGSDRWQDGFMGVLAMRSRIVVQNATIRGGRDGVYTHRAHGIVVRDSTMRGLRFGVHEMYTSRSLLVNDTVRNAETGLIVMTRPVDNALVGNDVRDSAIGLSVVGSDSYVAENVVSDDRYGIAVASRSSLYAHNTVVGNDVGLRADTLLPTNDVVGNDVVGNERQVAAASGPTRIWSGTRGGNYWGRLPVLDRDGDGVYDRAYRPTGVVDAHVDSPGARVLARSPVVALGREFQAAIPGLRAGGVADPRPLTDPVRPERLAESNGSEAA
ncbi:MAG: NosD domain-containing protein [Haloarculaceae archaeon]